MGAAFTRYRVIAWIVGVVLVVLVVIGMPLKYGFDNPIVVEMVGAGARLAVHALPGGRVRPERAGRTGR